MGLTQHTYKMGPDEHSLLNGLSRLLFSPLPSPRRPNRARSSFPSFPKPPGSRHEPAVGVTDIVFVFEFEFEFELKYENKCTVDPFSSLA